MKKLMIALSAMLFVTSCNRTLEGYDGFYSGDFTFWYSTNPSDLEHISSTISINKEIDGYHYYDDYLGNGQLFLSNGQLEFDTISLDAGGDTSYISLNVQVKRNKVESNYFVITPNGTTYTGEGLFLKQ
jgi:hypothetical protein